MAIFGKTDGTQVPLAPPERAGSGSGVGPPSAAVVTVIGPKARFVGEMSGDEDIVVHGRLEGNVRVNRRVTIAASGELKGDVHAKSVVIAGRVHGQIRADERAELLASASVQGNVSAPKVVIAEGAQLQGNVAMSAAADAPKAPAQQKVEEK